MRAFEYFGGVPGRIRYDNLKPAVVRVLKGRDRVESERFTALRSTYGFDSFFCIPGLGGAHEKEVPGGLCCERGSTRTRPRWRSAFTLRSYRIRRAASRAGPVSR